MSITINLFFALFCFFLYLHNIATTGKRSVFISSVTFQNSLHLLYPFMTLFVFGYVLIVLEHINCGIVLSNLIFFIVAYCFMSLKI